MTKLIAIGLSALSLAAVAAPATALDLFGTVGSVIRGNVSDPDDNQAVQDEIDYLDTSREEREFLDTSREEREYLDASRDERDAGDGDDD